MLYNNPLNYSPNYNNAEYMMQRQREFQKNSQYKKIWRASTSMGLFATAYLVLMYIITIGYSVILLLGGVYSYNNNEQNFIMQITVSVASALIPGFIFFLVYRKDIFTSLNKTFVPPSKLIAMIMFGMGIAMLANFAANLFDQNISIFGLKNQLSMSSDAKTAPEIILYVISTAVVPAFAEEFAYRGVVLNVLRKYGDGFAVFGSALLFGAMHGNTTQIVFAFILGLIFAYVDVKTNSIIPSVIIHFTNNFYAVITDILIENNIFDEKAVNIIYLALIIAFCVIGILSIIYLSKTDKNAFVLNDNTDKCSLLSFKDKMRAFFLNPGVLIALSLFAAEMILNLIPLS